MKKLIITLFSIISISSFALNQIEEEQGMTGLEISSFINYSSQKDYNSKQKNLNEKYSVIDSINDNLYRKLELDNYDKDSVYNLSINRLMGDTGFTVYNYDFLIGTNVSEFWRVGLNLSYADLRNTTGDLFQGNIFSKWFNGDDSYFISSIYGGTYKEKSIKTNEFKRRGNYFGITNKFKKEYLSFDEVKYIPYIQLDYQRGKDHKNRNQNLYTEIGLEISKIIYEDYVDFDKFFIPKVTGGFGHEFLEGDKYKELGNDEFSSAFFMKVELPVKVNVIEINPQASFSKSIVTSNFETKVGLTAKYSF